LEIGQEMYDKTENYSAESKYVANILSAMPTMASGSSVSSTVSFIYLLFYFIYWCCLKILH